MGFKSYDARIKDMLPEEYDPVFAEQFAKAVLLK